MAKWAKQALLVLFVAFVLFYLFTRPEGAAGVVKTIIGWFDAIIRFFEALAS